MLPGEIFTTAAGWISAAAACRDSAGIPPKQPRLGAAAAADAVAAVWPSGGRGADDSSAAPGADPLAGSLHAGQSAAPNRVTDGSVDAAAPGAPAILSAAASSASLSGVLTSSCPSDSFGVCVIVFYLESLWRIYQYKITEGTHVHAAEPAVHRRLFVGV
jgi:hypothetical protein